MLAGAGWIAYPPRLAGYQRKGVSTSRTRLRGGSDTIGREDGAVRSGRHGRGETQVLRQPQDRRMRAATVACEMAVGSGRGDSDYLLLMGCGSGLSSARGDSYEQECPGP
jgi:hypothetical protein